MRALGLVLTLLLAGCSGAALKPAPVLLPAEPAAMSSRPDAVGAAGPDPAFLQLQQALGAPAADAGEAFAHDLQAWRQGALNPCARPLQARYFQMRFSDVQPATDCPPRVPFMVNTAREGMRPVWVDPRQVRAIHLMFAGNGKGAASRFGHVALRLVICPEATASDAACNANLYSHVVLGFMAHVDAFEISILKGLVGQYRAHLFASPFMDTYQEYAIVEFRDIYSVPLVLDTAQREAMVRELAQIHWQYDGDYTFFGNNCASLLQRALQALMPAEAHRVALARSRVRPDRLFRALRESGLVERDKLADLRQAERDGFYFSSTRPYYEKAAAMLATTLAPAPYRDVHGYLATSPERRRAVFEVPAHAGLLRADKHLAGAAIILEELALVRAERQFGARLAQFMDKHEIGKKAVQIRAQLNARQQAVFEQCVLTPLQAMLNPVQLRKSIPEADEVPEGISSRMHAACMEGEAPLRLREVLTVIGGGDSSNWQSILQAAREVGASIDNLLLLRTSEAEVAGN